MITEFPLFLFTTLGGLAAGAYVAAAALPRAGEDAAEERRPWLFPLACLVLLGAGLLGVLGHLGRPERFLLALANPSAMIAEEAYWSIALGLLMLADLVLLARKGESPRAVRVLAAACGFVLTCVMGWAYFTAFGNPAWAAWPTLPLFVLGDLAMGAALWALFAGARARKAGFVVAAVALDALAAASIALAGARFAALGHGVAPFAAGAVLALAAAVAALLAWKGRLPEKVGAACAFALVLVGVAVARYSFYAASVL